MSSNTLEVNYAQLGQETRPLLEAESKPEVDTQLVPGVEPVQEGHRSPTPPRGVSILFLDPEANHSHSEFPFNIGQFSAIERRLDTLTSSMSSKTRKHLGDVGRGCVMVIATPFLIVALALYTVGTILEGIAMVMKGASAVGGSFIVRRRGSQSPSVIPSEWV
ncbi:hypothetical protein D9619_013028 [Psilocybe cf. subviscida]|uniref:Uncharacterized protein n=1 Tax=Psilocybe cf. subviscida TaxID=2480587 RepID=A0A8H5AZP6_9AGAR|nr:hypothetical protein D9619_013028 [Psilocybe cf. subviscida]